MAAGPSRRRACGRTGPSLPSARAISVPLPAAQLTWESRSRAETGWRDNRGRSVRFWVAFVRASGVVQFQFANRDDPDPLVARSRAANSRNSPKEPHCVRPVIDCSLLTAREGPVQRRPCRFGVLHYLGPESIDGVEFHLPAQVGNEFNRQVRAIKIARKIEQMCF